ncbi:hypothetical protein Tco_1035516 [Tanacetum coccineum]
MMWQSYTSHDPPIGQSPQRVTRGFRKKHTKDKDFALKLVQKKYNELDTRNAMLAIPHGLEPSSNAREFESMVRRDIDEIYIMLDDEQSQRQLLAGQVNMLFRDRRAYAHTRHLMETEARMSREAWGRSMDASDLARAERAISDLLKTDRERREEMRELRAADRTRQQQIIQTLTVGTDIKKRTKNKIINKDKTRQNLARE